MLAISKGGFLDVDEREFLVEKIKLHQDTIKRISDEEWRLSKIKEDAYREYGSLMYKMNCIINGESA
jgi:hypothetical protein